MYTIIICIHCMAKGVSMETYETPLDPPLGVLSKPSNPPPKSATVLRRKMKLIEVDVEGGMYSGCRNVTVVHRDHIRLLFC